MSIDRMGIRPPRPLFRGGTDRLHAMVARAEAAGIDRFCVGDHVSFHGGQGNDGLVDATALAALARRASVATSVYLLPLRHPVPVARQVATLAALVPGRVEFGVGVGGEDRAEVLMCGVDPATRGARMDESLRIVRRLLAGERLTVSGPHFDVADALVLPAPEPAVPILVGGRSRSALRRVAELGDGWLAMWVSADRFAAGVREIGERAVAAGRPDPPERHGLHVWCGFGPDRGRARALLAEHMGGLYRLPFDKFDRYAAYGTPEDVADSLRPYVSAGCRDVNLIPVTETWEEAVDGVAAVRRLLDVEAQPAAGGLRGPGGLSGRGRREPS